MMNTLVAEIRAEMKKLDLDHAVLMSEIDYQIHGSAEAIFQIGSLLLRFERDHGFDVMDIGCSASPKEFFFLCDVFVAFGWETVDEVAGRRGPVPLSVHLGKVKERIEELEEIFSRDNIQSTREKVEEAASQRSKRIMKLLTGR